MRSQPVGSGSTSAPNDSRLGGGYGRAAPARFGGRQYVSPPTFPYDDGIVDEEEDSIEPVSPLSRSHRLASRLSMSYISADPSRVTSRDRDKFYSSSSRLDLAHRVNAYDAGTHPMLLTLERIFTVGPHSSPDASKFSGSVRGWASPPIGDVSDVNDDPLYGIDGLDDYGMEPVKKHVRRTMIRKFIELPQEKDRLYAGS